MLSGVSKEAVCIFCGTSRPVTEPRCPECGNGWIDETIAEAVAAKPVSQPAFEELRDEPEKRRGSQGRRRRWVFPVAITAAAAAVYAIVFVVLILQPDEPGEEEPVGAPPTATAGTAPETTPIAEPTTTVAQTPTTTAAPTTTTTRTTSTTTPTTTLPTIAAAGEPIALEDLTLGAFSLGPLAFGDEDTDALGRLVSTFGQPDDVSAIGEADGLCPTESGRAARFGWLTVYVRDEPGTEVLVGYRVEESQTAAAGHPTAELKTISGAAIGDTFDEWNSIYRTSVVTRDVVDGVEVLLLLRSSDERTLLWAPLTADDPPAIAGVYSPRPCDGGPFGSS